MDPWALLRVVTPWLADLDPPTALIQPLVDRWREAGQVGASGDWQRTARNGWRLQLDGPIPNDVGDTWALPPAVGWATSAGTEAIATGDDVRIEGGRTGRLRLRRRP